jgi:hypothetical protein
VDTTLCRPAYDCSHGLRVAAATSRWISWVSSLNGVRMVLGPTEILELAGDPVRPRIADSKRRRGAPECRGLTSLASGSSGRIGTTSSPPRSARTLTASLIMRPSTRARTASGRPCELGRLEAHAVHDWIEDPELRHQPRVEQGRIAQQPGAGRVHSSARGARRAGMRAVDVVAIGGTPAVL